MKVVPVGLGLVVVGQKEELVLEGVMVLGVERKSEERSGQFVVMRR